MIDRLNSIDVQGLPVLEGFAAVDETKLANASLRLEGGRTLTTRLRHSFQVISQSEAAARQLSRLPKRGESIHCVLRGEFALFDFIPAVIRLSGRKVIQELKVATLGFSKRNVDGLAALIADGMIGRVSVLCSHYFSALDSDIYQHFVASLPRVQLVAMRTHAKVLLMRSGTAWLSVESSANLRSCHNVETATITNDRRLYEFHAGWIDELARKGSGGRK